MLHIGKVQVTCNIQLLYIQNCGQQTFNFAYLVFHLLCETYTYKLMMWSYSCFLPVLLYTSMSRGNKLFRTSSLILNAKALIAQDFPFKQLSKFVLIKKLLKYTHYPFANKLKNNLCCKNVCADKCPCSATLTMTQLVELLMNNYFFTSFIPFHVLTELLSHQSKYKNDIKEPSFSWAS